MKTAPLFRFALPILLAAASVPVAGQTEPRAGEVVRLLPAVGILRADEQLVAEVHSPVHLRDVVTAERDARVRIRLEDGSVINLGAESSLTIAAHDAAARRGQLELTYGQVRARVVREVRSDTDFEIRTPVAVAGVVGTHFWVAALSDSAEILCLEGQVRVRNVDPSVAGTVFLAAGEFTRVARGMPPVPPAAATPEQTRRAVEETDIAVEPIEPSRDPASTTEPPPQREDTQDRGVESSPSSSAPNRGWLARAFVGWSSVSGPTEVLANEAARARIGAKDEIAYGLELERRLTPRLGIELGLLHSRPRFERNIDSVEGEAPPLVGEATFRPITAGLNFHITPERRVDLTLTPFAGYALYGDLTFPLENGRGITLPVDDEFVWGLRAAADIRLGEGRWGVSLAARHLEASLRTQFEERPVAIALDPVVLTVGLSLRWAGTSPSSGDTDRAFYRLEEKSTKVSVDR